MEIENIIKFGLSLFLWIFAEVKINSTKLITFIRVIKKKVNDYFTFNLIKYEM